MPWRMVWTIPWLLAALLPVLLTQESTAQDENLLINGGFEEADPDGRPLYWLAVDGELTVDDALVHNGSSAGVFSADSTYAELRSHCFLVAPSSDYEFLGYAASREGDLQSRLHLEISWHDLLGCSDAESGGAGVQSTVLLEEPEEWYELSVRGRSGANARAARVHIVVESGDVPVHLDDFAVSGPPALPETPTPSPSLTPHASPTASSWQMTPVAVEGALRNGGFEEADSEGRPSSWQQYGGELARTNSEHFDGQFAAALSSQTNSSKWAYQVVTVQGGSAYVLSAYALKADQAVAAAYLRLSWYASPDGSGQAIDSADSTERLTDDSPEFRFLTTGAAVAPAEAASAKARLMLDPAGQAPGAVYFDAVALEETALPEPTLSPTATPSPTATLCPVDGGQTPTPPSPTPVASTPAAAPEPRAAYPTVAAVTTTPRPSPTRTVGAGHSTPAALGAAWTPVATATAAAATATREPASVFRQRKSDSAGGGGATAREESVGGGLSPQLLALAAGVPALAGAGAGAYYWRWRRARLR
jgi:hypothetical protein